jgi:hypothetical protein
VGTHLARTIIRRFEMITTSLKRITALAFVMLAITATSLAQGPMMKKVYLTINVPYRLRMGDYMLSSGKYTIYQVMQSDPNLFFLYRGDMETTPIAAIRTVRVDHAAGHYPGKTEIRWLFDEESSLPNTPVVTGWEIPGEDGFEIVSVVARHRDRSITAILR